MQYNHIFSFKKAGKYPWTSYLVKAFIFIAVAGYLWYILRTRKNFNADFIDSVGKSVEKYSLLFLIPVMMFFLNWSIEAVKWKYLCRKIEKVSFWTAFSGILTGVALGLATPFSIGDFAGRILQLEHQDRGKAIGAVLVSRLAQFFITLLLGGVSLFFFYLRFPLLFVSLASLVVVAIGNVVFLLLFFFHQPVMSFLRKVKVVSRLYSYIEVIGLYSRKELALILFLSLVRYLVFTLQFILVLYFFDVSDNFMMLLWGVNLVFLVKSFVPTFFDLGVRESAAVYFFSFLCESPEAILSASLSIWIINIILPSLIGLFLVFRLKIFPVQ